MSRRLAILAASLLTCLSWATLAVAHDAGLSRGRYDLRGSDLEGHVVFASSELLNALPRLDGDVSGALSQEELDAGRAVIASEIAQRLTVTADAGACPVQLVAATAIENDAVELKLTARCPNRPARLTIHCGFLEVLSSSHRHLATVSTSPEDPGRETIAVPASMDVVVDVAATPESSSTFFALLRLGVEHILTGYDHLVFLFGLILLGGRARSLIAALTAFTLAHSISLALAVLGVWSPRPSIVEPMIALSIAYVGLENLWLLRKAKGATPDVAKPEGKPADAARGRWRITFPFGLVHGFGFAGALAEIGLPRARVPGALLAFNLGVELGQLAVLALVLPLLTWARGRFRFVREPATTTANVAIVVAGLIWFVARVRG